MGIFLCYLLSNGLSDRVHYNINLVKRQCGAGFVETRDPVSSTEIEIAALDHDEMAAGAGAMVKSMVAVLKAEHQKYASLPDDPGISDDEKKSLAGPEDMAGSLRSKE